MTPQRVVWCLVPLALAFAVQDPFKLEVLALASIQGLYVASWDLLGGVGGLVSLGHALPFGIGAYVAALLAGWGAWPPAAALAAGALAGAVIAALQGKLGARLPPVSLALLTLAMAECVREVSGMLEFPGPGGMFIGGDSGVPGVAFPSNEAGAARITAAVLAAGVVALQWLARSKLGLALRTARADDRVAAASGIDAGRVRMTAFALAGGVAGIAGGFTAALAGRATPSMLSLETSLFPLAAAGIGGPGTIIGPTTAGYVVTAALQWLDLTGPVRLALYALLVIAAGLAAPEGIVSLGGLARGPRGRAGRG